MIGSVAHVVAPFFHSLFLSSFLSYHSYFFFLQNETHLCRRFSRFVTKYDLMSKDNLIVPILEEDQESEDNFQPRMIDLKTDIGEENI